MKIIKDYWHIIVTIFAVTFGYANFTAKVNAHDEKLKVVDSMQKDIIEIKVMVNRIDERTSGF